MFEPIGYILCNQEFKHSNIPDEVPRKEALLGQVVQIMEKAGDGNGYLVAPKTDNGPFLWMVDIRDTVDNSFMPITFEQGIPIPSGLSEIEKFKYMAEVCSGTKNPNS